jgi:hypothetical protein
MIVSYCAYVRYIKKSACLSCHLTEQTRNVIWMQSLSSSSYHHWCMWTAYRTVKAIERVVKIFIIVCIFVRTCLYDKIKNFLLWSTGSTSVFWMNEWIYWYLIRKLTNILTFSHLLARSDTWSSSKRISDFIFLLKQYIDCILYEKISRQHVSD